MHSPSGIVVDPLNRQCKDNFSVYTSGYPERMNAFFHTFRTKSELWAYLLRSSCAYRIRAESKQQRALVHRPHTLISHNNK